MGTALAKLIARPQYWLFLLALVVRLPCVDCRGLWYDEIASLEVAGRGLPSLLTDRFGWMLVQTPLHYFIVWVTSLPIDPVSSAFVVRLPSILAGAATAPAIFMLARETVGRAPGIMAAAAYATFGFALSYSHDLRPYSQVALLAVLAALLLVRAWRTGKTQYWLMFSGVLLLGAYLSYFTISLVLPALVPMLLAAAFSERGSRGSRSVLIILAATGLALTPVFLDALALPRTQPDLLRLTPELMLAQFTAAFTQLTRVGVGGVVEAVLQWAFFLLALMGAASLLRARAWRALVLCGSFLLIPSLLMAIFRTSNTIFQRYILFTLPFYLLLAAAGIVGLASLLGRAVHRPRARTVAFAVGTGLLLIPAAYSAYTYHDPSSYRVFGSQPDYRGVAAYLRQVAGPEDVIVLADEPALANTVLSFQWRGAEPAPTFDARDPRLVISATGSTFVVVSFLQTDATFLGELARAEPGWDSARLFERAVVVEGRGDTTRSLERVLALLATRAPAFQPVLTLRGTALQAKGDAEGAASLYRDAGEYFATGEEYLETAKGYLARGDRERAWREALISKFMRPSSPELHSWLADRLAEEGMDEEARLERAISERLEVGEGP